MSFSPITYAVTKVSVNGEGGSQGTQFSQNFDYDSVAQLNASAPGSENVLYFIPSSDSESGNLYDEYIWNTNDSEFEKVGASVSASIGTDSNVTANKTVGAITAGTTIPEGTDLTTFLQKLLIDEIAPTINFSISQSGNKIYGTSYRETLTLTITSLGTATPTSIDFYSGSTLLGSETYVAGTNTYTFTMDSDTSSNATFKGVLNYKKSDNNTASINKTASISFFYEKFYGNVSDLEPSEATITALSSAIATAKGGTYAYTFSAQRAAYAYPSTLGTLSSIKDGNGFSLMDSFTRTQVTYTRNGTSVPYYLYVLTDASTVSNYNITFA